MPGDVKDLHFSFFLVHRLTCCPEGSLGVRPMFLCSFWVFPAVTGLHSFSSICCPCQTSVSLYFVDYCSLFLGLTHLVVLESDQLVFVIAGFLFPVLALHISIILVHLLSFLFSVFIIHEYLITVLGLQSSTLIVYPSS